MRLHNVDWQYLRILRFTLSSRYHRRFGTGELPALMAEYLYLFDYLCFMVYLVTHTEVLKAIMFGQIEGTYFRGIHLPGFP